VVKINYTFVCAVSYYVLIFNENKKKSIMKRRAEEGGLWIIGIVTGK
jgi:hypothetical protein